MALPQLPNFVFPTSFGFPCMHSHFEHPPGQQNGQRNCGNTIAENQKFLSPTFYLSLQLLLNFGNGIATIPSLSSDC